MSGADLDLVFGCQFGRRLSNFGQTRAISSKQGKPILQTERADPATCQDQRFFGHLSFERAPELGSPTPSMGHLAFSLPLQDLSALVT